MFRSSKALFAGGRYQISACKSTFSRSEGWSTSEIGNAEALFKISSGRMLRRLASWPALSSSSGDSFYGKFRSDPHLKVRRWKRPVESTIDWTLATSLAFLCGRISYPRVGYMAKVFRSPRKTDRQRPEGVNDVWVLLLFFYRSGSRCSRSGFSLQRCFYTEKFFR